MSGGNGSPRITYKDIIAFREKVFDELTEMRKESANDRTAIRDEISDIKVDIRGQDEKFKGLIRRDTIGYVLDAFITAVAIAIGIRQ